MKNFKINTNRQPLTDADINAGKDFSKVLESYNAIKAPFYKTAKFWFGASALAVVATVAVLLFNGMDGKHTPLYSSNFINPPVAECDIKKTGFIIPANADTVLTYQSGSKIQVPANAFLDESGKVVTGEVELKYREFHDIADVFIAGIPMTYDSAGEQYHFETAGMMEISAWQNGKQLNANPEALIKVQMVSGNKEDRFNSYYLDTVKKQWVYETQSNFVAQQELQPYDTVPDNIPYLSIEDVRTPEQKQIRKEIQAIEQTKPVAPKKVEAQKPRFTIRVEKEEFPEIAIYENMKFQVEDKDYDPAKAAIVWEDIKLERIPGSLNYKVIFSKKDMTYNVVASPVFAEKDYKTAQQVYETKFKEYETALQKKKEEQARIEAEIAARAHAIEEQIKKEMAERQERMKVYEASLKQQDLFYRAFTVQRFGIWNCDCPSRLPSGANVIARFETKDGKAINVNMVYLIERGNERMFTYYPDALKKFQYSPMRENALWLVTSDLKIGVVSADDFKEAAKLSGSVTFKPEIVERQFKSTDEVKEFLKI